MMAWIMLSLGGADRVVVDFVGTIKCGDRLTLGVMPETIWVVDEIERPAGELPNYLCQDATSNADT